MPKQLLALLTSAFLAAWLVAVPTATPSAAAPASAASAAPTGPAARAAATGGGSIVFIRKHDIWLVRGNGTGLHRVTRDGTASNPYRSPSMSDAGIIAAARGTYVVRMRQNGAVLNRFDPPALTDSVSHPMDGVLNYVAISPNGKRVAYGWSQYSCPIGASCQVRSVTAVSAAARYTAATTTSYLHHPSWVSNDRLMVHGGYLSQMMLQDVGGTARHWFDDDEIFESGTDLGDASLSRDGRRLVAIRGYGDSTQMIWYDVSGDPRSATPSGLPDPAPLCIGSPGATATDEKLHDPTWSPDGTAFAIGATEGLWVVRPGAGSDCGATDTALLGAGSSPSWSGAAIDPPAPARLVLKAKPTLTGVKAVGKRLRATKGSWSPAPATVRYTWLRNGTKIKGATKASYRLVKKDRGRKISVKVVVSKPGLASASARSKAVRIR
ncbi:hypothetical protein E8D34_15645 [Nocardioides sp. GY 10113]|uniref:hypothetical protein n=1 Tax=Nocardioides sp. GY 10113 TaxID=2569761 RepID=UPI0010A8D4F6|nr:hypothetical protein [Nocardioides sp. GY 10113]TIC83561.1 hypothetical protein E8D34_15645 [Nocardioides sp. GY 10113]